MAKKIKPHRGLIDQWYKMKIEHDLGLGYVIFGKSINHPRFSGGPIRTSYVVKHEGNEIETNNSRYTLAVGELSGE